MTIEEYESKVKSAEGIVNPVVPHDFVFASRGWTYLLFLQDGKITYYPILDKNHIFPCLNLLNYLYKLGIYTIGRKENE
jgi:hypothetical protein